MLNKRVTVLTGTRADFGKLLPIIREIKTIPGCKVEVVATGMHLLTRYGYTIHEIYKAGIRDVFPIFNQDSSTSHKMDVVLANSIIQIGHYVNERKPDLLIVHGDRVEALAGAIAGSLNNILVGHIEGGELSGTIDETIRHGITKMSHIHFVTNEEARGRVLQLGELESSVFVIGSPEVDIMLRKDLPTLAQAKKRYGVKFEDFSIFVYHPVTTESVSIEHDVAEIIDALQKTKHNFIVIRPNNDPGSDIINSCIDGFSRSKRIKVFPSLRFEYYLTLLKHAKYIVGNSSSGVREAPVYGTPCVNIGSRQSNRNTMKSIVNVKEHSDEILTAIQALPERYKSTRQFGDGNAAKRFAKVLRKQQFWSTLTQKQFCDRP